MLPIRKLITFDWAIKRLLRSKANFEVLEGFLSELLKEDVIILDILESESNQEHEDDKFNRLDLKVRNHKQEIILIEIQFESEKDYFSRILYGASKTIAEHMVLQESYEDVVKVISVNILYFNLGKGEDYIYHGTTHFKGIHKNDELTLTKRQKKLYKKESPYEISGRPAPPEYYLLRINQFDDVAKDSLDQWIYFLKNEEIKEDFDAKGLEKAKDILALLHLPDEERQAFDRYIENRRYQKSIFTSTFEDGKLEGEEAGIKIGKELGASEEKRTIAKGMKQENMDHHLISKLTGISLKEIEKL